MSWQRPFRETSDFAGIGHNLPYFLHPPIPVAGEWRVTAGGRVHALKPERLFYLEARANAEITTPPFEIGAQRLTLHGSFESVRLDQQDHFRQGYLMAELRTADDQPIPGFEKEGCVLLPSTETALPLVWGERLLPTGQVRLKLYFRAMRIHALSH